MCAFRSDDENDDVPPDDKDWAYKLTIPTRFSTRTMKAVQTGVLTPSARVEITNSLSTLILVHTTRPKPEDYKVVCRRLVEKHSNLRDKCDSGNVS